MSRSRRRSGSTPPATESPRHQAGTLSPGSRWNAGRSHALALAVPFALTLFAYFPALAIGFAGDDVTFLSRAAGLEPGSWATPRLLSGPVAWSVLYRMFGLEPAPYNVVRLLLHLVATALVYAAGYRLLERRPAAALGALLFGVSSVAFTPLHSASGIGELLVAVFALGSLWLALDPNASRKPQLTWMSAGLLVLAMLSKEVAILAVLSMMASSLAREPGRMRLRLGYALVTHAPQLTVATLFVIFLAIRSSNAGRLGGAAYEASLSPAWLAHQLLHYTRWAFDLRDPIPDRVAATSGSLSLAGGAIAAVLLAAAIASARRWRRAEVVGASWFVALLALVLPLTAHSYLYYLYAPWAGACWGIASLAQRAWSQWPNRWMLAALGLLSSLYTALVVQNVSFREQSRLDGLPVDRTVRESLLLQNCMAGLRAAGLNAPDSVCFVNPFPQRHQPLSGKTGVDALAVTYVPLAGALRDGETLRLFQPGIRQLGFSPRIPQEWEQASAFFYDNDGTLQPLGRGAEAQRRLGALLLEGEHFALAEPSLRRALALGDTSSDAAYGFLYALAGQGRQQEAERLARAFIARWPRDPRTRFLREGLASEAR